jgi:Tfp pilus assembly protein PilN
VTQATASTGLRVNLAIGGVDLRPAALSARQRLKHRVRVWTIALLVWSGVVTAAALALTSGSSGVRAVIAALDAEGRELAGMRTDLDDRAKQVRSRIMLVDRGLEITRHVARHPDWGVLMRALASRGAGSVALESVELERVAAPARTTSRRAARGESAAAPATPALDRYTLRLSGLGRSQEAVSAYVLALEGSGLFERVTIQQTEARRSDTGIGGVGFRLEASLVGAVPPVRERGGAR